MATSLKGATVLVVDDDRDTCELLRTIFEINGAQVVVAQSVETAIEAFRRCPAHVLVSDIRLGSSDGFVLVRAIRESNKEYHGFTPAIALTGYASPREEERAKAAGFHLFITKPFEPIDLVNAVAKLFRAPTASSAGAD
jgi:CheY-like chemotaxis protein